jgi:hypothetical protein
MGVVTEHLIQLIAKQVEERGLVVWYDPDRHYRAVAADLTLSNTSVARYEGSFLQLLREIDPLLNDQHPPRRRSGHPCPCPSRLLPGMDQRRVAVGRDARPPIGGRLTRTGGPIRAA